MMKKIDTELFHSTMKIFDSINIEYLSYLTLDRIFEINFDVIELALSET